ncbi:MAG: shewanella-like protein phosphatase [Polyangiales bacterium]
MKRLSLLLAVLFSLAACERTRHDPPPARPTAPAPAPTATKTLLSARLTRPAAAAVIAIGDLHGDLTATRSALRLAGAIDDADRWVGGKLVVVQTGDVLDRGDEDRAVLDLLDRLRDEAKRAGGELISLAGNHEVMNVMGDFRYITQGGFDAFGGPEARLDAFKPGGPYALRIAERSIYVRVGDTLFVHGGVLDKHVEYGLDRIQDELRAWMRGERPEPPLMLMTEDGPIWTRLYSDPTLPSDCEQLSRVLAKLDAKRMVVGHTPQQAGITSACEGKVWRIDTGMSRFYGGKVEVLELRGGDARVRKAP